MKWLFLTTLIVLAGNPSVPGTAVERRLDKSGEFSYELPKEWRVLPGRFRHDLVVLPAQEDGGMTTDRVAGLGSPQDPSDDLVESRAWPQQVLGLKGPDSHLDDAAPGAHVSHRS